MGMSPVCRWRTAAVASAAAVLASLVTVGTAVAGPAAATRGSGTVAELRADLERTGARLAAGTVGWERGRAQLNLLVQTKFATARSAELLQHEAEAAQLRVASLANSLYRNPVNPVFNAVLAGNFYAVTDYAYLTRGAQRSRADQGRDLALLNTQLADTQSLLRRQDEAASSAIRLQATLDDSLAALQADAVASQVRLQAAVDALRRQREAALLLGRSGGFGPSCSGPTPADALNGFLPNSALCPLQTAPGQQLIGNAARAFDAMSAAYAADSGKTLCVTDSYRDYAGQVSVFSRKPNLAAVPGRSQHGWGRALDLCGGIERFGSPAYTWMKQNAPSYGFHHPDWAEPGGGKPEAWHWEFGG